MLRWWPVYVLPAPSYWPKPICMNSPTEFKPGDQLLGKHGIPMIQPGIRVDPVVVQVQRWRQILPLPGWAAIRAARFDIPLLITPWLVFAERRVHPAGQELSPSLLHRILAGRLPAALPIWH